MATSPLGDDGGKPRLIRTRTSRPAGVPHADAADSCAELLDVATATAIAHENVVTITGGYVTA